VFTLNDVSPDKVEAAERAHAVFKDRCPVYRSLHRSIDVTTELTFGRNAGEAFRQTG
jgi:uncharacterized OsmC-like protein